MKSFIFQACSYQHMLIMVVKLYKVHIITCHESTEWGEEVIPLLFMTLVLDLGEWSVPCPGCFAPGKELEPTVEEGGWSWRLVSPPPVFKLWTVQHVGIHYTDYTFTATNYSSAWFSVFFNDIQQLPQMGIDNRKTPGINLYFTTYSLTLNNAFTVVHPFTCFSLIYF